MHSILTLRRIGVLVFALFATACSQTPQSANQRTDVRIERKPELLNAARAWTLDTGPDRNASASMRDAKYFISPDRQLREPGNGRQADLANP